MFRRYKRERPDQAALDACSMFFFHQSLCKQCNNLMGWGLCKLGLRLRAEAERLVQAAQAAPLKEVLSNAQEGRRTALD